MQQQSTNRTAAFEVDKVKLTVEVEVIRKLCVLMFYHILRGGKDHFNCKASENKRIKIGFVSVTGYFARVLTHIRFSFNQQSRVKIKCF